MIIRLSRATIRPNSEPSVFEILRAATESVARPAGLVTLSIGRRMTAAGNDLIAVTIWESVEALVDAYGPTWRQSGFPPALEPYLEDPSTEHYETVIDAWEELTGMAEPDSSGRTKDTST
jgi:hypothetical protein